MSVVIKLRAFFVCCKRTRNRSWHWQTIFRTYCFIIKIIL